MRSTRLIDSDVLLKFAEREWSPLFVWFGSGVLAAAVLRLIGRDKSFRAYLSSVYFQVRSHFEGLHAYSSFALIALFVFVVAIAPQAPRIAKKYFRSWWFGVVSGLRWPPFLCALASFTIHPTLTLHMLYLNAEIVSLCFISGYFLHLKAHRRAQLVPKESEVQVTDLDLKIAGTTPSQSDDPIEGWDEDILERAPLIDSLSFSLLISRTPVIALFGEFGSGKTSTLNLLRKHLQQKAIVVSFSTWLPGSSDVLASNLLGDIAKECSKKYVIPGIRKDTRKLAGALAKNIPTLNAFSELFSDTTQRQDIEALGAAISQLPKRVIVLLDEVDRMQKSEILALLKIVRGISASSNLSFVYAFDREIVEKVVTGTFNAESHTYFEKFFPTSITIPLLDAATLRRVGIGRLVSALHRRNWFEIDSDEIEFATEIEKLWDRRIAPLCQTLRAVGLFANDVGVAASPLKGEVNPLDLAFIELLRRFEPSVYEIIWRYRTTLTGAQDWLSSSYQYLSDSEKAELGKRMVDEVEKAVPDADRLKAVKNILHGMFPLFRTIDSSTRVSLGRDRNSQGDDKRISDPALISAYFRYKLPEDLFSSRSLDLFLQKFGAAPDTSKAQEFFSIFDSMQKGDRRRADFLDKLAERVNVIELNLAEQLGLICMTAADKFVYDSMFVAIGEAGHVLRIIIRAASRITNKVDRIAFLSKCIQDATDDTLALRIQTVLTKPGKDFDLEISFAELYPSFVGRMRRRYGRDVDTMAIDLTSSDPQAFNLWGLSDLTKEGITVDPKDRAIQRDFWLAYIGTSKSRLGNIFGIFFLPLGIYQNDPAPFVENKIPISDLENLQKNVGHADGLSEFDQKSLNRLAAFLKGNYKNGIFPGQLNEEEDPGQIDQGQEEE
jgi:hypothetical protein